MSASSVSQPLTGGRPLAPSASAPVLEIEALHHRWRGAPPVLVDVSISLRAGEATWVGGSNGAGKTTLLRLAAGILLAQRGSVRIGAISAAGGGARYRRQIGFLSAGDRGLQARMRVRQQLDYWARLAYVPRRQRGELVAIALRRFALEELAEQRVDRMSMGQRQRIRLAMAFLHEPRVLLLDEPRNSLDEDGRGLLREQVERALAAGATVLWCSPSGEEQALPCHVAYDLRDGRLERVR